MTRENFKRFGWLAVVGVAATLLQRPLLAQSGSPVFESARLFGLVGTTSDATGLGVLLDVGSVGGGSPDGVPDLVTALQSQQIAVLFGRSDGTFATPPSSTDFTGIPTVIAAGDLDGDTTAELVVGDSSNQLSVFRAAGGTFVRVGQSVDLEFFPRGIAVGDFDRDGHLDVVVVGETLEQAGIGRILFGNGDATLVRAAETIDLGPGVSAVATADFNSDELLDLAVTSELTNEVIQYRGDGQGGFSPGQRLSSGGEGPTAVSSADLNRDGRPDIVVLNGASDVVAVAVTQANGQWSSPRAYRTGAPASSPRGLALGDVNGDGRVDVVVANNFSFDVGVLFGDGTGGLAPVRLFVADAEPVGVVVGDLNRDNRADIVALTRGGGATPTAAVLLSSSGNRLAGAENIPLETVPNGVAAGDLDGDGLLDLVVALAGALPGQAGVGVAASSGGPGFVPWPSVVFSGDATAVAVSDTDGDTRPEIIVLSPARGTLQVYRPRSSSLEFAGELNLGAVGTARALAVGDFNRDGRGDVVVSAQGTGGGTVSVFVGSRQALLQAGATVAVGDSPLSVASGDFNRDGAADIVTANNGSINISVALGNGDGTFRPATSVGLGQAPRAIAVADFDRDGFDDVAVAFPVAGTVQVLFGDGTGRFPTSTAPLSFGTGGEVPSSVWARDVNGDGLPDIVASGEVASVVRVFTRSPTSARSFQSAGSFPTNRRPVSMVVGDFDGDGRYDAAAAASSPAPTTTMLRNVAGAGFRRGEANQDGRVSAADLVALTRKVGGFELIRVEDVAIRGGGEPLGRGADADGDGVITPLDLPAEVAWVFR
ncbi:MAG: VCBS repeat-containing protein [Candidatus Binatia bacterium]|nr:VCBS repeat-containing protein [Candidatus Binatia bacterium]